jgi:TonB family protein
MRQFSIFLTLSTILHLPILVSFESDGEIHKLSAIKILILAQAEQAVKSKTSSNKAEQEASKAQVDKTTDSSVQAKKNVSWNYLSKISEQIKNLMKYPKRARRLKQEDKIIIRLKIRSDGTLTSFNFIRESKFLLLNQSIASTLKKISHFPKHSFGESLEVSIPIEFKL